MLELRNKAAKMADAGTTKMANTRDRMTSQPSKNINWNAEIKSKPPPPPKPPAPLPPPTRISSANNTAMSQGQENSPAPPVPLRRLGSSASPSLSRSTSQVSQISKDSILSPELTKPLVDLLRLFRWPASCHPSRHSTRCGRISTPGGCV